MNGRMELLFLQMGSLQESYEDKLNICLGMFTSSCLLDTQAERLRGPGFVGVWGERGQSCCSTPTSP